MPLFPWKVPGFRAFASGCNVASAKEVDLDPRASGGRRSNPREAGAESIWGRPPGDFADPDGFLREVAWNPTSLSSSVPPNKMQLTSHSASNRSMVPFGSHMALQAGHGGAVWLAAERPVRWAARMVNRYLQSLFAAVASLLLAAPLGAAVRTNSRSFRQIAALLQQTPMESSYTC